MATDKNEERRGCDLPALDDDDRPPKHSTGVALPALPLRGYQFEAAEAVLAYWRSGPRGALVQLPTGCGKTVLGLALARALGRCLWLAHRDELVQQPLRRVRDAWPGVEAGVVQADQDEPGARDLVFASVQTLARAERLEPILAGGLELVVVDEAHHYCGAADRAFDRPVLRALEATGAKLLGLTATVERGDGAKLDGLFDRVVYSLQLREAIDAGYLAPFAGVRRVRVAALEHTAAELAALAAGGRRARDAERALEERVAADLGRVVRATAEAWQEHAIRQDGSPRRGVVYTVTVEQAERTAEELAGRGVRVAALSGVTPRAERRAALADLERGALDVVTNAALLTEGWDCPPVDAVLLARPCSSKGLFLQCIGRASRLSPGKLDWLVIDLGGGSDLHSLEQAPLLDGAEVAPVQARQDEEARAAGDEDREPARLLGGSGRMPPEPVRWLDVFGDGQVLAASAGAKQTVTLRLAAGRWQVEVWEPHHRRPVGAYEDLDLAHGVAADAVRRLGGLAWGAARAQGWRALPATAAQRAAALRWGIALPVNATKGEASDAMTRAVVTARLGGRRRLSNVGVRT